MYSSSFLDKLVTNVKNMMTDKHIVETKLGQMITEYKESVLPNVISNWNAISEEQKEHITTVHKFHCALNALANIETVCEDSIKTWEQVNLLHQVTLDLVASQLPFCSLNQCVICFTKMVVVVLLARYNSYFVTEEFPLIKFLSYHLVTANSMFFFTMLQEIKFQYTLTILSV